MAANPWWPDRFPERLARCLAGLACFGLGISMFVASELGVPPWDVFHLGVSDRTGIEMGTVIILTGFALLLLWIPLRQRPGWGTLLNALEIGLVVNVVNDLLPHAHHLVGRVAYMLGGLVVIAVGSGLYIGAGLGAGPRDGLMLGLAERGFSVRAARTSLEVVVLAVGWLLGGPVGVGTLVFAVGVGPLAHYTIPWLRMRPRTARRTTVHAAQ